MIVSNPPYIPSGDIPNLEPEISQFEPLAALDAGPDGLVCLRHLIQHAWSFLRPGGHLILEIGFDQKEQVAGLFGNDDHYQDFTVHKDYVGHDRVVSLKRVWKDDIHKKRACNGIWYLLQTAV
jgi:release factor glutamine methyltransferase